MIRKIYQEHGLRGFVYAIVMIPAITYAYRRFDEEVTQMEDSDE